MPPRGLSPAEAALWARVAATVAPLRPVVRDTSPTTIAAGVPAPTAGRVPPPASQRPSPPPRAPVAPAKPSATFDRHGLDGTWERKLARAAIAPDFTIDLHGHTLDTAHQRLDHGLTLALSQGARLVLVIAGRARPTEAADRGTRRGAIRAKLIDWLAAGPHAARIAAIRPAHPRHGGGGAVYVILRRSG